MSSISKKPEEFRGEAELRLVVMTEGKRHHDHATYRLPDSDLVLKLSNDPIDTEDDCYLMEYPTKFVVHMEPNAS